ncbi:MAG: hypothetical protein KKF65_05690, partial [Nanoarchaeota archaeon]|nr:hypothetical protein [Nanoarchaeota archaeon]
KDFNINTGEKIIFFLNQLIKNKIEYKITKPIPRCVFGNEFELLIEKYGFPKNCADCLEFLKIKDKKILFCENCKISNLNQTKSFNICSSCKHKIRNTCNGFCL